LFTDVTILNNVFNRVNVFVNRTAGKITPVRIREIKVVKVDVNKKDLTGIKAVKG